MSVSNQFVSVTLLQRHPHLPAMQREYVRCRRQGAVPFPLTSFLDLLQSTGRLFILPNPRLNGRRLRPSRFPEFERHTAVRSRLAVLVAHGA